MTRAKLIKHLYDYRTTCARIDMLTMRIRNAERWMEMHGDDFIAGTQLAGRTITDMPIAHGGASSPTEKTAMRLMEAGMDGGDAKEIGQIAAELDRLNAEKSMLDILIGSLRDRERFVITAHLIDGLIWRETGRRYAAEYGNYLTDGALQAIMRRGLDRMLEVSEG